MKPEERRRIAREWCDFAINRSPGDPVYRWVTENRDPGPIYSSCGDLAHWLLARLGCKEFFCNRDELKGSQHTTVQLPDGSRSLASHPGYRPERNVNLLTAKTRGGANALARKMVLSEAHKLQTGDVLVMWPPKRGDLAHVCVVDAVRDGCLWSWDFGQGPRDPDAWRRRHYVEGFYRRRPLSMVPVQSWLNLDDVPLVGEVDLPSGERFDALEARRDDG